MLNIWYMVQRSYFCCIRRQSLQEFIESRVQQYGEHDGDMAVVMRQLVLSGAILASVKPTQLHSSNTDM